MGRQIVEDDDIARPQGRHEHLLNIGLEYGTVHRPIMHERRGQAGGAQRPSEGRGLAMAMRHTRAATFTGLATVLCRLTERFKLASGNTRDHGCNAQKNFAEKR